MAQANEKLNTSHSLARARRSYASRLENTLSHANEEDQPQQCPQPISKPEPSSFVGDHSFLTVSSSYRGSSAGKRTLASAQAKTEHLERKLAMQRAKNKQLEEANQDLQQRIQEAEAHGQAEVAALRRQIAALNEAKSNPKLDAAADELVQVSQALQDLQQTVDALRGL